MQKNILCQRDRTILQNVGIVVTFNFCFKEFHSKIKDSGMKLIAYIQIKIYR
jgi:hypothetical protein